MEKIKKFWKEISVFGVVIITFLGLFAYNKIMFTNFTTISAESVVEKINNKDSFVVVVGNNADSSGVSLSYQTYMKTFVEKNRSEKLYYVDFSSNGDTANEDALVFMNETFQTEFSSIPQTFVIKDGEVVARRENQLTYAELLELYQLKK